MSNVGHIRDFTQPNPEGQKPPEGIKRQSHVTGVDVHEHEQVIADSGKIRKPKRRPGEPDVRIRLHDPKSWEKVKTDEDIA